MTVTSAVTIKVSPGEVTTRLSEAEPPISDGENVEVTTSPAPGGRGTELRVRWATSASKGLTQKVAAVLGVDPQRQLDDALRRFKQLVETGEVMRSDGSPHGTDAADQRRQQPAQPAPADPAD